MDHQGARPTPRLPVGLAVLLFACLISLASAQNSPPPEIYNASPVYKYQGCFNETVDLPGTARERALPEGSHRVSEGTLTAPDCLAFCGATNNGAAFKYAGMEYSRECWCGSRISALAGKRPDSECNTPCDGNKSQACGGALKLSIYMLGAAPPSAAVWSAGVAGAMGVSLLFHLL